MQAEIGAVRADPAARLGREERLGHRLAEQHFDAFASGCFEAQRERRAVSDLERVGTLLERAPRVLDVLLERVAAHLRTDEHLLDRNCGGPRDERLLMLYTIHVCT